MVVFLGSTLVWAYTHTRIDSLIFGVFLSYLYHCRRGVFDELLNRKVLLLAVSISGLAFLSFVADTSITMRTIGYTVNYISYASLILLTLNAKGSWTTSIPYRLIAWIGLYSYSIYIWHNSVRTPLFKLSAHLHGNIQWPVLILSQFVCAVCLGVVMAKLIEWPFLRLRERFAPTAG
jgi:peptidoglycan/LPS O-acetylase OafA/YrhL